MSETYTLPVITTAATQRALFELNQRVRDFQLHLLKKSQTKCSGCIARSLAAVAMLNSVRLLLRPLHCDLDVSDKDRHAAALHAAAILKALEAGEDAKPHLLRLVALHRTYYNQPTASK